MPQSTEDAGQTPSVPRPGQLTDLLHDLVRAAEPEEVLLGGDGGEAESLSKRAVAEANRAVQLGPELDEAYSVRAILRFGSCARSSDRWTRESR